MVWLLKVSISLRIYLFIHAHILPIGLAQTAVHRGGVSTLIPSSFFEPSHAGLTALVPSFVLNTVAPPPQPKSPGTHAFTILARILNDPKMEIKNPNGLSAMFALILETRSELVRKYAEQWTVNLANPMELENKIEELIWTNALIYAVGGWAKNRPFKADFFTYVGADLYAHTQFILFLY